MSVVIFRLKTERRVKKYKTLKLRKKLNTICSQKKKEKKNKTVNKETKHTSGRKN